ncbi:hypothetical protein [Gorillibacterium sp. sgz5001074]|uniref:hypothetical protein n=1 Tax=Gorillibacterium sp. sgz5001074 TaxID=3446695 RepID=UPI003F678640
MRMTTFLVGAAAGAAAVMYMNRTNKSVMMSFSQMGDNLNKAVDKAMMSMADRSMKPYREPENSQSLDKVEQLVNCDPQVRSEVDQILAENQMSAH